MKSCFDGFDQNTGSEAEEARKKLMKESYESAIARGLVPKQIPRGESGIDAMRGCTKQKVESFNRSGKRGAKAQGAKAKKSSCLT